MNFHVGSKTICLFFNEEAYVYLYKVSRVLIYQIPAMTFYSAQKQSPQLEIGLYAITSVEFSEVWVLFIYSNHTVPYKMKVHN